ncbi:S8 family serine peptidase [Actinoplanes sp. NEAU-A12]|uniref:S8 family serine peptidase n=1 Tax=Actinoplanes sandaracinus TaxID=3045177 RepID=A0ABT6WLW3_9ACTN|nr:S8 family serine peptidase [Actinoplanes sandaracinus]MDI6100707.1 S8 family serine peptidase [Actinoplanes sandaracinus]
MRLRNNLALLCLVLVTAGCTPDSGGPSSWPDLVRSAREHAERLDRDPVIAVVDSGVEATHPALRQQVVQAWSAPGLPDGRSPHGTQIAGLIAGRPHGEFSGGLVERARLLDVRVLDDTGQAGPGAVAEGIDWAVAADAAYIVTSFGTERDDPALRAAVARAVGAGVVVVAAAGNGFGSFDFYPAAYPGVVAVTAHDGHGKRLALANGKAADLAAPGNDLLAPIPGGRYQTINGTSAAAAVAAGVIAACRDAGTPPDPAGLGTVSFPEGDVPALECQQGKE